MFLLPYPLKNMTTGAFSSVFAPVPVQTPQQKAYIGGLANSRLRFWPFSQPTPLKNHPTATFLPVFATVDLQHLPQKTYIEGLANARLRFRLFSQPWICSTCHRSRISRVVQTHGYVLGSFCDRAVATPATGGVYRGSCKRTATFLPVFATVDLQHMPQEPYIEDHANARLRFRPFSQPPP